MGLFTKDIQTMDDLFLHLLQDIYYAEKQILKALPDMIDKATNRELTAAFKGHLAETEKHVSSVSSRFSICSANLPRARNARRSTGSSARQTRSPRRSRTSAFSTRP